MLTFDLDRSQHRRASRNVARRRDHGENGLAVKYHVIGGKHRLVGIGGRNIVLAGNVLCGKDSADSGIGAYLVEIEPDDPASCRRRSTNRHVQRAFGFADIVDIIGGALHVLEGAVMRHCLTHVPQDRRDRLKGRHQ